MGKIEILNRINFVCKTLNNISITGIQNACNLAGCYEILNEIYIALQNEIDNNEEQTKNEN